MMKILVVDDSYASREIFSEILQSDAITVMQAANGLEAKQKIEANAPDLIITDLIMPQMNGYELCRWVKNNPKTRKIPVVVCSAKGEKFDRYWGMKQGADAYVTKPFAPPELLKTVNHLYRASKAKVKAS